MEKPLRDVIRGMRGREGMYVRSPDWNNVVSFIHGFSEGQKASGVQSELEEFEIWLETKVGYKSSSGWTWVIEKKFSDGDPQKILNAFYELWDEFLQENP